MSTTTEHAVPRHALDTIPRKPPMSLLAELWQFLRVRKKYWLAPIIAVLLIVGGLLVLVQGSALAPFIYALF